MVDTNTGSGSLPPTKCVQRRDRQYFEDYMTKTQAINLTYVYFYYFKIYILKNTAESRYIKTVNG